MDLQGLQPTETRGNSGGVCDESKCVSKGKSDLYDDSFTCYGDDGTFYPMMCADGFLPVIVDNEPPQFATTADDEGTKNDVTLRYFTCCSPDQSSSQESIVTTRHCSDPITQHIGLKLDSGNEVIDYVCEERETENHTRQMKASREASKNGFKSFLCCDNSLAQISDQTEINKIVRTSFLDDTECVPYRNEFYAPSRVTNKVGMIQPVTCDVSEGDFTIPRPVGTTDDLIATGEYQCCKSGPSLPPFVKDTMFKATIYPPYAIYCVSILISVTVFLGLLIPLLIQLKNGTFRRTTARNSANRSSGFLVRNRGEQLYSTYNLYLVYLTVFDFFYCFYRVWRIGGVVNQQYNPAFHSSYIYPQDGHNVESTSLEAPMVQTYAFFNLWLNAIICYEVLDLLRMSKQGKRKSQPTIKRVNLQAGAGFCIAMVAGVIIGFLVNGIKRAENDGNKKKQNIFRLTYLILGFLINVTVISYVFYTPLLIWWRGYMPSLKGVTPRAKAVRELAFYFFRIVAVFLVIWLPVIGLIAYGRLHDKYWVYAFTNCLTALQPTLTACFILTRNDARNYIWDLVTLSYLFGSRHEDNQPSGLFNSSNGKILENNTSTGRTDDPSTAFGPSFKTIRSLKFAKDSDGGVSKKFPLDEESIWSSHDKTNSISGEKSDVNSGASPDIAVDSNSDSDPEAAATSKCDTEANTETNVAANTDAVSETDIKANTDVSTIEC